jgi:aromatic-L-amino-acid decarboxylase
MPELVTSRGDSILSDHAADVGDLDPVEAREALRRAADLAADYLEQVGAKPVLARVRPGELLAALPAAPPEQPESMQDIFADYRLLIEPALTHWNHPGFFAYFAITGSAPGIAAETLAAATNVNAMLWRTSPAATELEERACDWLRQMLDLPAVFRGHINDTASISTLLALAAARHRALPQSRELGLAGGPSAVVYASVHAHASVDKAAMTLGLGLHGVRHVPADASFRLDPGALRAMVGEDRAAGRLPIAVVATAGTTSTTSVDPLRAVAEVCADEQLWLHVDAAYGGSAAICPEYRALLDGLELADSIVSTRTSGCSCRWIARCSTPAATRRCATRSRWYRRTCAPRRSPRWFRSWTSGCSSAAGSARSSCGW